MLTSYRFEQAHEGFVRSSQTTPAEHELRLLIALLYMFSHSESCVHVDMSFISVQRQARLVGSEQFSAIAQVEASSIFEQTQEKSYLSAHT